MECILCSNFILFFSAFYYSQTFFYLLIRFISTFNRIHCDIFTKYSIQTLAIDARLSFLERFDWQIKLLFFCCHFILSLISNQFKRRPLFTRSWMDVLCVFSANLNFHFDLFIDGQWWRWRWWWWSWILNVDHYDEGLPVLVLSGPIEGEIAIGG